MGKMTIWNAFYIAQTTPETCWHAAYETMVRYKAGNPAVVDQLPNAKEMSERGIYDSEFMACASRIGLEGTRYTYFKDIGNVEYALQKFGPIWVSGFYASGHKHIVTLAGVDTDDKKVYVNDPFRGWNGAEQRASWWDHGWFANRLNPVPWACQHWPSANS